MKCLGTLLQRIPGGDAFLPSCLPHASALKATPSTRLGRRRRRRMVCCSLRCSRPPRGWEHAGEALTPLTPAGEGTSDAGQPAQQGAVEQAESDPTLWMGTKRAAEKATSYGEPRTEVSRALALHEVQLLCICTYRTNAPGFSITGPHSNASSRRKSTARFLPAKTSQAGATIRAAPIFSKLFRRPTVPQPFSLYLRLPSNPSFSSQPAAFGGLKRCVHPQGWVPLPSSPLFPAWTWRPEALQI